MSHNHLGELLQLTLDGDLDVICRSLSMDEAAIASRGFELEVYVSWVAHVKPREIYSGISYAECHDVVKYICWVDSCISVALIKLGLRYCI